MTEVNTYDEESLIAGSVLDWWCPAGVIAPYDATEPTTCRLKTQFWVDFDYSHRETLTENWSPT